MLHKIIVLILAVIMLVLGKFSLAQNIALQTTEGDWNIAKFSGLNKNDPFVEYIAVLEAKSSEKKTSLRILCFPQGGNEITFSVGKYLLYGEKRLGKPIKARLKFDDRGIKTFSGTLSEGEFVIASKASRYQFNEIISEIKNANQVAFEIYSHDDTRIVAIYPTKGFSLAIQHVEETCAFPSN